MVRAFILVFGVVLSGLMLDGGRLAFAQAAVAKDDCSSYHEAVTGGSSPDAAISAPPVPVSLLTNWKVALPCLVIAIAKLGVEIGSPNLTRVARGKFLRATGAIRTIMANNSSDEKLRDVVEEFRSDDNPNVTSVLAFGARSDDYNSRLNAMLILSNVIDNTTVCVPIDHLYDPALDEDSEPAIKGRANLLAIISVVAPWAFKENYENIAKVRQYWVKKIPNTPKYKQTNEILENIKVRLESQKSPDAKRFSSIPEKLKVCKKKYAAQWAKPENFVY